MSLFNLNPLTEAQKEVNKLIKLAQRYKTNKTPNLGFSYVPFYYNLFADKKENVQKVLQIGLGDTEKNSLYFWQDFFPNAKIYAVSDDKKYVYKRGKVQTFLADRWDSSELKNILKKTGYDIDVVIDEGTRSPQDIVSAFQTVMPLLKKDTNYIIENTDNNQASYITDNLNNYNFNIMRHHKMISRYDRLISVTNKA